MRKLSIRAFIVGSAVFTLPLMAAVTDTVRTRIAAYRELGAAFKSANDGLRGDPQTVLLQQAARQIRNAAKQQYGLFPAGSGPQPGVKTAARAEIWSNPVKFKASQDAFAKQADIFQKAVSSGNAAIMRAETRKLGATCKACHDTFRVPSE